VQRLEQQAIPGAAIPNWNEPFLSRKDSQGIQVRFGSLHRGISFVWRRIPDSNWRGCPGVDASFAKFFDQGGNKTFFSIGISPRRYQHFNDQHLVGARLGQGGMVQINPEVAWSQRKEPMEKVSSGYPAAMLAAWMALEGVLSRWLTRGTSSLR
jgi:hypothetical protein